MLLFLFHNHELFFRIASSVAEMAALNPRGDKMFFPNEITGFINLGKNLASIHPKAPPSFINSFICALLNFISVDILFSTFFS